MREQLTKSDVKKIEQEIEYRKLVVRKEAIEAVKEARAHGDLSENFEYHAAKKDKNKNESRIRYLENMIRTAHVILVKMSNHQIVQRLPALLPQVAEKLFSCLVVARINEHRGILCLN